MVRHGVLDRWIVQSQSSRFQRFMRSNFMRQLFGSPSVTSMTRLEAVVMLVPTAETNVVFGSPLLS